MYCLLAYREVIRALEVLRQCLIQSILTNGRKSEITVWISQYLDNEIVKEMKEENKYVTQ